MKTNEFIEEARDLGLFVEENKNQNMIWIKTPYEDNYVGEVKTDEIGCRIFDESKRFPGISKLIYEYGMTPLEEREEEKNYVYRMNFAVVAQEYLKATKKGVVRFEGDRDFSTNEPYFKSEFTDAEVENYPKEVRELFKICEKIEVSP